MPRILVTTEPIGKPDAGVMLDEHIATSDLASNHFAAQLIERIGWALADAEATEHRALEQPQLEHPVTLAAALPLARL
jgi:hypothetical protein